MTAIQDIELNASQPAEKSCADCRFGAGFPQGPRRLMRCVNSGHPTVGQFLKDPVACEGFQARAAAASKSALFVAPAWARCGDCEHVDLFTVESACVCSHPVLGDRRPVRSIDAPVCASLKARLRPDLSLHTCQHGVAVA
jgi:hypothetical protein